MAEEKQKKIAALLRKSDVTQQTAVQIVSQNNLSSDKIVETNKAEVNVEELATRIGGIESVIPQIDIKIGKVSKKVDSLKSQNKKKFERISEEIDIIANGMDNVKAQLEKKITKLTSLVDKQKEDNKDKKKVEKGNDKIITVLSSMLDFMKRTYEEDVLMREQQNNYSEELKAEKDRKDKALLDALKSKKKGTAEKITEDKPSFFEKLLGAFSSILSPLKALVEGVGMVFKFLKNILSPIMRFLVGIGRFFLFSPLGIALLAGVGATVALLTLLATDKNPEQTTKSILSAANPDAAMGEAILKTTERSEENAVERKKQNILKERPASKKSMLFWKDPEMQKSYLNEIGWDEKTGTTEKERASGAIKIDESGKLVYKVEQPKQTPEAKSTGTASTNEEGQRNYKTRAQSPETAPAAAPEMQNDAPKVTPQPEEVKATPIVQAPNLGTKVAEMSTENALTKTIVEMGVATTNQVSNIMAATKKIVEHTVETLPAVRNQEETFQRMIYNSTRVV